MRCRILSIFNFLVISVIYFEVVAAQELSQENLDNDIVLTSEEREWILSNPVLTAVNTKGLPPLDFILNGKAAGYSIDYLNLVANKVGLKIEYVSSPDWESSLEMVRNKEIDILHAADINETRSKFLNFSSSYLEVSNVNLGRVGAPKINSVQDLENKRIGVIPGLAITQAYINNYPHLETIEFNSLPEVLRALASSQIDVFTGTLVSTNYVILQNYIPGLEIIGNDYVSPGGGLSNLHLATHKGNPTLIGILNKGIALITNAELMNISKKWLTRKTIENSINLTTEELVWLAENNTINVVIDLHAAPLDFIENNSKISGISGSYLGEISKKLNVTFKWAGNRNWNDGLDKIRNNKADVLTSATPTFKRKEYLTFTDNYMSITSAIFARMDRGMIGNMDTLVGKRISQVSGHALTEMIREDYPQIEIVETDTILEALRLVDKGAVDAYIGIVPITLSIIEAEYLTNLGVVGETLYREDLTMAIRSNLPLLASAMQKAISSISTIKRAEINRQWLGKATNVRQNYTLIWQIIAIAVIILSIFVVWIYYLRREMFLRREAEEKLIISQAKAEHANKSKSNFLANMSHEIRTPLNAIIGFSDTMTLGIFGEIKEPRYREYLNDIKSSGEHLALVINDILDLSKIEAGKWQLNREVFALHECVHDSMKITSAQAEKKELQMRIECEPNADDVLLNGDVHSIKRVLINLFSNAIKFTDKHGEIICKIKTEPIDSSLLVEVIDNGIGIAADKLPHVLDPFNQAHDVRERTEVGTGLGLSIVKHFVELHGFSFYLKSEKGVGTRAIISIPAENFIII